jgi:WD40 repeat protein
VTVWQVSSGEPVARWRCLDGSVLCLAFAPDSRQLVCGGGWPAQQAGALAVWDADSQRLVRTLPWSSEGVVRAQGLSRDGSLLAAGGGQGVVAIWRTCEWSLAAVWKPHQAEVYSLAAGPEGWWSGDAEGVVLCWNDQDGTIATRWELPEAGGVMALARASDAMLLATAHASDQSLRLWDLSRKRPLAVRYSRTGLIRGVALWPRGKMLASGGGLRALAGQLVLTSADGSESQSLPGHGNIISCLSLSRSGRWLASADADGQLLLWDAEANWQPRRLVPR